MPVDPDALRLGAVGVRILCDDSSARFGLGARR
jgi:hypothetical protein